MESYEKYINFLFGLDIWIARIASRNDDDDKTKQRKEFMRSTYEARHGLVG